jgi:hypothetical protein
MPDFSFLDDGADNAGGIRINTTARRPSAQQGKSSSKESWNAVRTVLSWAIAAVMIGGCWHWVANLPEQTEEQFRADDNRVLAVVNAQSHVKTMLRSPRSAKWPGIMDGVDIRNHATKQGDGTYIVRSWVDADNAFGASIRTWYVVHLRVNRNGIPDILSAGLIE